MIVLWYFGTPCTVYTCRLSAKIRQLVEGGLVKHWMEIEKDKVGKSSQKGIPTGTERDRERQRETERHR